MQIQGITQWARWRFLYYGGTRTDASCQRSSSRGLGINALQVNLQHILHFAAIRSGLRSLVIMETWESNFPIWIHQNNWMLFRVANYAFIYIIRYLWTPSRVAKGWPFLFALYNNGKLGLLVIFIAFFATWTIYWVEYTQTINLRNRSRHTTFFTRGNGPLCLSGLSSQ